MAMTQTASIYGLTDKDGAIRYIGKARVPAQRLKAHMRDTARRDYPLHRWLRKNGLPGLVILEADCADWRASERRLIAQYRNEGARLLNVADGGDEPFCNHAVRSANGRKLNERLLSDPLLRRVRELKRKLMLLAKGGHLSAKTRAKLRERAIADPDFFGCFAAI